MKEQTIESVREDMLKRDFEHFTKLDMIEIFNLGVELAQKEFLYILDCWIEENMSKFYKNKMVIIEEDLKKLKQKLGDES